MQTCDVAVIGGGISGAACAYELSSNGLRVALLEPNAVVSGETNLGYGSIAVAHGPPGLFALTRYGSSLWDKVAEWLPEDCEYQRQGTLCLAAGEVQMQEAARQWKFLTLHGIPAELLDTRQVAEAEPAIQSHIAGGLLIPGDGCLQAGKTAEFLIQLAAQKGAQILRHKAASIVDHEVSLEGGMLLHAGNIVVAMGGQTSDLLPTVELTYSKTHLLVVETAEPCARYQLSSFMSEQGAEGANRFQARQSEPGVNNLSEVWVGWSDQPAAAGSNLQVEPRMVARLLRSAIEMIPAIGRARPSRSWTGVHSSAPDGLPLIGRMHSRAGMFSAAGYGAYGVTAALAGAKLIADEILCRTPEIDPKPYLPNRFERDVATNAK